MSMKVYKDLQTLVLLCLLHNSLSSGPNGRVVSLRWCQVHSVEVASHGVQAIVPTGNAVRIEHHDHFEDEILSEAAPLIAPHIRQ